MGSNILQVISPVIGLAINVFVQILLFKYSSKYKLLRSISSGFIAGMLALCAIECYIILRQATPSWSMASIFTVNLITYCCLGYCYFHFINLGETARRIRLLRDLYDAPGGLREEDLLSRYNAREVVNIRLTRLLSNNQIILRDSKYYIASPVMLLISKAVFFMKVVISGKAKRT